MIGLTVMAFGTGSPEMVVRVQAAASGNGAISVGNVVGSNICKIPLILGLCALVTPLTATAQVIRREVPIMIGTSVVALLMLMDGHLARWEGGILLAGLITYTVLTVKQAYAETAASEASMEYAAEIGPKPIGLGKSIAFVVGGLVALIAGSHFFVTGAVTLAESWGMSQVAIGLTIVAVGTSLPELATYLVAALKKESDVAIGNVVGSNTFNLLGILGVAALIQPIEASGLQWADLIVMLVVAVALLPLAKSGGRVTRWEGAALLTVYAGYTTWLLLQTGHAG